MQTMAYPYKRESTLPRRTFIVNVTCNWVDDLAVEVTAPDPITAESIVRTYLYATDGLSAFSFDMIREVTQVWDPECAWRTRPAVVVTVGYTGRITAYPVGS